MRILLYIPSTAICLPGGCEAEFLWVPTLEKSTKFREVSQDLMNKVELILEPRLTSQDCSVDLWTMTEVVLDPGVF